MLSSRNDFMLFTFRVHNSVNRRLNKPIYQSVTDCFEQLRNNVKTRTARDYRISYLNHIRRFWRTMQDASGLVSIKKINEMTKIEIEYLQKHDNNFQVSIPDAIVVLPGQIFSNSTETSLPVIRIDTRMAPRMGLNGGRFQIRR